MLTFTEFWTNYLNSLHHTHLLFLYNLLFVHTPFLFSHVSTPPPPHNDSPRFVVQWVAGSNTRKRHFMGGNSSADILQCHSGLAPHAFVLFVNRSALSSGGKVCCLFEPGVRIDSTDLGGSQQVRIAERHPHLSTDDKLCTLCVHYLKPCPFFAKTSPRITLPATPESLAQSTTAVTPAKNKPD